MGYSAKPKGKSRGHDLHDYDFRKRKRKIAWPESCEDSDGEHLLESIGDLRDAVDDLHQLLSRVYEVTEHVALLLCESLHPDDFSRLRYVEEKNLQEAPFSGYGFSVKYEDVPF